MNKKKITNFLSGGINALVKIFLLCIIIYPFAWMILTSFKPYKETLIYPPTFFPRVWTVEGYQEAFKYINVLHYLKNSLVVAFAVLTLQFIIVIPSAYAFARCRIPFKGAFFAVVLLGFMLPQQVVFIPLYMFFSKVKLLKSYWPQILPFISNAFGIFLLRQYFMQIPEEIIEAARLDHASELKIITHIMIPQAKSALFAIGLIIFIGNWNSYFWPLIMTTTDTFRTLPVGVAMLKDAEGFKMWNMIMAGNVILSAPILIAYAIANKQIRKAFVYSGIK